jgi:hypothetical protein
MRSTKDLLLYLSLVGMVGFAGLSYYLYKESVMSGKAAIFTSSKSGEESAAPAGQTPTAGTDAQSSGAIDRDEDGTDTTQTTQAPVVIPEDKPVVPEVPTEEDRTGFQRASRIMGINTADVKEDTSSVQFVNIFKSAIPFYETTPWGSGKEVEYDAQGWPIDLHGGQALTKFLNRLPVNTVPDGFYTVLYDGKGTIHYGNDASLVAHREGMDIIEIKAGPDRILNASLAIKEIDKKDYIRNIRVLLPGGICNGNPYIRVDDESACKPGAYLSFASHYELIRYNPDYLNFIKDFQVIRFMNMSGMTRNPVIDWDDRNKPEKATWGGREGTYSRGAPVEVMIDIANKVNADAWFSMPYQASDDYIRKFADMVNERLKPGLKAYIEYSNEIWNPIFVHHDYAINQGLKLGLDTDKNKARTKYHSLRSVQVFDIWEAAFGGTDRLIRVMGAWTSNPRMSNALLTYRDAYKKTDALAVAPYFGATIKEIQNAKNVDDIFKAINNRRSKKGFAASVRQMEQQSKVAEVFDVDMIAYEGGQHLVDWNTRKADDGNNELLYAANRDRRMGDLYKKYMEAWEKAGGKLFVQFSAPRIYSWYGSWGIKEYISQSRSEAPKYDAILSYMEQKAGIKGPEAISLMNTATAQSGVELKKVSSPDVLWSMNDFWPVYLPNKDPSKVSKVAAKWQAYWDETNLYLAVAVEDGHVETGDGIELTVKLGEEEPRSLELKYGEAGEFNPFFTQVEHGYKVSAVIPWEKLSKVPEVGDSMGFDIQITDVDKDRKKATLHWAERAAQKAGDHKMLTAAVKDATKLGNTKSEIEFILPTVTLIEE